MTSDPGSGCQMPMESWAASEAVRRSMLGNRSRDTIPELRIRSALHAIGLRFRVHARPVATIARRADVVLRGARVAIFVDGCFWHGCPEHYRLPATNQAYWHPNIEANRRRDRDTDERLRAAAWTPLRIWEHEPVPDAVNRVLAHLGRETR